MPYPYVFTLKLSKLWFPKERRAQFYPQILSHVLTLKQPFEDVRSSHNVFTSQICPHFTLRMCSSPSQHVACISTHTHTHRMLIIDCSSLLLEIKDEFSSLPGSGSGAFGSIREHWQLCHVGSDQKPSASAGTCV